MTISQLSFEIGPLRCHQVQNKIEFLGQTLIPRTKESTELKVTLKNKRNIYDTQESANIIHYFDN